MHTVVLHSWHQNKPGVLSWVKLEWLNLQAFSRYWWQIFAFLRVQVAGDYCTDCVNFFADMRQIFNNSEVTVLLLLYLVIYWPFLVCISFYLSGF